MVLIRERHDRRGKYQQRVNSRERTTRRRRRRKKGNYELLLHNSRADIYVHIRNLINIHANTYAVYTTTRTDTSVEIFKKRSESVEQSIEARCASSVPCLQHHPEITESPSCVRVNRKSRQRGLFQVFGSAEPNASSSRDAACAGRTAR
uniref:Uncharacterized protein n=1 Tax=Trichogramma kaykai TaxID=54128 RepID=A0ABD2VWE9_9HYME